MSEQELVHSLMTGRRTGPKVPWGTELQITKVLLEVKSGSLVLSGELGSFYRRPDGTLVLQSGGPSA